jgi:hypothetical protein
MGGGSAGLSGKTPHVAPMTEMVVMYPLMSIFRSAAWRKLIRVVWRRSVDAASLDC